jgi:hypothetical protein
MKLPRYINHFNDRHGHARFYFRREGFPTATLPGRPWSPEFMTAYEEAMACKSETPKSPLLDSTLVGGVRAMGGVDPNTVQPQIGVYLLLLKGMVAYIGSSLKMPNRVADHRSNGRPFDQVFYIATRANERERLEVTLIKAIDPSQNRMHRSAIIETNGNSVTGPASGDAPCG